MLVTMSTKIDDLCTDHTPIFMAILKERVGIVCETKQDKDIVVSHQYILSLLIFIGVFYFSIENLEKKRMSQVFYIWGSLRTLHSFFK